MELPEELLGLLRERSIGYVATTMPDGSPQVTQTWVDTDDKHVIINVAKGHVKTRNIERDGRVAVAVSQADNLPHYFQVRGRVVEITTEGAAEHIEALAQRYLGTPYPWYWGPGEVRVIVVIEPESLSSM